jgi:hypothetical protein
MAALEEVLKTSFIIFCLLGISLNKMWYINELEYDSTNSVDIEISPHDPFLE